MKNSQAKRLSEELLNVDQKIVADAFEIDDAKKLKEYTKLKTNEAKKPFYITATFKRATAVAACLAIVAVTAFTLTKKPDNNITSNSSETSSQNKKVIYVTGDTADEEISGSNSIKSLKLKYISRALQEKMDLYKDYTEKEVVYCVIMEIFAGAEDGDEGENIAKASPEVEALWQQFLKAAEEEDKVKAEWNAFNKAHPGDEPEVVEKRKELVAIEDEKREIRMNAHGAWEDLYNKIIIEYCSTKYKERLEFATQFCKNPLERTSYDDSKFYVELSAEEINTLAEKGGYAFRLASEKIGAVAQ